MHEQSRILIVDDNPVNIAVLEELLSDDYQLRIATTGEEALAIAPDFAPDVILLDIMMPGIDGYETCRRIRLHPSLRHTKIILVSGKAMVSERLRGYAAGADDYVVKPFDNHELRAKVAVFLRLKSVEELERLKSELLALLSHETNTPLNGILPPLELLLADDTMNAAERQMWLQTVYDSVIRLRKLFTKVTTLSLMKSGQWAFNLVPVNLTEFVRHAVADAAASAAPRHVWMEQALPEITLTLLDMGQMREVLSSLLENAVRFSAPEGCVTVTVQHEGATVCLAVTDHGVGMASEHLTRIFEEFTSADIDHHTAGQNLSLAIARHVVLAHQGTIQVSSTQGVGTTFRIRLPLADRSVDLALSAADAATAGS